MPKNNLTTMELINLLSPELKSYLYDVHQETNCKHNTGWQIKAIIKRLSATRCIVFKKTSVSNPSKKWNINVQWQGC